MKKLLLTYCLCCLSITLNAQDLNCKEKIISLHETYKVYNDALSTNKNEINNLKKVITTNSLKKIDSLFKRNAVHNDSLHAIYSRFLHYKMVCLDLKFVKDSIKKWFPTSAPLAKDESLKMEETETVVYSYFGKDQIITENFIDNNTPQGRVLKEVISNTNEESYFGDITIPKEHEEFYFLYKSKKKDSKKDSKMVDSNKKYTFKKIELELRDGSFTNIRVTVGYQGNTHTFENHIGVSFMYFATKAKENILFYKQSIINNKVTKNNELGNLFIRLSDVMSYNYKTGNHFIPHDLTLELPKNDINGAPTNKIAPAAYQIKQKTYLDKIVEFRTYTDFLSLFGEGNNGLVSIEANAKFYVFPFPRPIGITQAQWEFLPSITTNITYNRFEEGDKIVSIPATNFTTNLDLIEKRFLRVGANVNIFQVKHKSFPIKASIYSTLNYQLTQVNINNILENAKGFSYGVGLGFSTKRFNNFGFNIHIDYSKYDYKNSNTTEILRNIIPVVRGQAEVFYHPTKSPNQAVFTRLSTFNHVGKDNNQAFYQFQFGYKFSIGSRTVKK